MSGSQPGQLRSGHEKLSLEVLDNDPKSRAFALVILKMLTMATLARVVYVAELRISNFREPEGLRGAGHTVSWLCRACGRLDPMKFSPHPSAVEVAHAT